jgi:hypothetical protein
MAEHNANQNSSISGSLHPLVNIAIIGLVLMFVAAVWMFFDSGPTRRGWMSWSPACSSSPSPFPRCCG